jgi:hypothetical protein
VEDRRHDEYLVSAAELVGQTDACRHDESSWFAVRDRGCGIEDNEVSCCPM